MAAIKRSTAYTLRNGAATGRKVMLVKIFHQFKGRMNERKSWASSKEAKSHAIFECLAHNLLLLLEKHIEQTSGLRDGVVERKQQGRTGTAPGPAQT